MCVAVSLLYSGAVRGVSQLKLHSQVGLKEKTLVSAHRHVCACVCVCVCVCPAWLCSPQGEGALLCVCVCVCVFEHKGPVQSAALNDCDG